LPRLFEGVDGRDKPGHDGEGAVLRLFDDGLIKWH
jgi:hypothetical protein